MKKIIIKLSWVGLWLILMVTIGVVFYLISNKDVFFWWSNWINDTVQAGAIVTLALVTWSHVIKTRQLVDVQNLAKDLDFNERRLQNFYNPFISHLDYSILGFIEESIEELFDSNLKEAEKEYIKYFYMISPKTGTEIDRFFVHLHKVGSDEKRGELNDEIKDDFFKKMHDLRYKLHKERTLIEEYISAKYPFPEKKEQGSES
jgi:hypothetical protein